MNLSEHLNNNWKDYIPVQYMAEALRQFINDKDLILVCSIKSLKQSPTHIKAQTKLILSGPVVSSCALAKPSRDAQGWPSISSVSVSVCHCHNIHPDSPGQACWLAQQQN